MTDEDNVVVVLAEVVTLVVEVSVVDGVVREQ